MVVGAFRNADAGAARIDPQRFFDRDAQRVIVACQVFLVQGDAEAGAVQAGGVADQAGLVMGGIGAGDDGIEARPLQRRRNFTRIVGRIG